MVPIFLALTVQSSFSARVEETRIGNELVVRRKSGRVLWRRAVADGAPFWSPSGKALVSLGRDWSLVFWREGEKVRKFKLRAPFTDGFGEPPGFPPIWSPAESRILLRVPGAQGGFDLNLGTLMTFHPSTGRQVVISERSGTASWIDDRTVAFEDLYPAEVSATWKIVPRRYQVPR